MRDLPTFLKANPCAVRVRLVAVQGSSPREAGASMFVSAAAIAGTIGGGQLEYMAIDEARSMLRNGRTEGRMAVPLGPEIGQCCGGFVELALNLLDDGSTRTALREVEAAMAAYPTVVVFGSGHVGRALAGILTDMPIRTVLVDDRKEELDLCGAAVEKRLTPLPEEEIRRAPDGSAFVIATNDHAVDFLIAAEALSRKDAAYVGLIGSRTKRSKFLSWLRKNADSSLDASALTCPIGVTASTDKRPEIIALFVAAEVVARLTTDRWSDTHRINVVDSTRRA